MNRLYLLITLFSLVWFPTFAQIDKVEILRLSEESLLPSLHKFNEFLKIPNNGRFPDQIQANLNWCQIELNKLGFETQVLSAEGVPHLFAKGKFDPAKKTILVYMQIDGQAVDTSAWNQKSPFIPALKKEVDGKLQEIDWSSLNDRIDLDWKIFARSASDSKGPAMSFLTAMEIFRQNQIEPAVNLKLILDFQEELSSPELAGIVEANQALFAADGILIMDGTRHLSNLPNLAFGARGIATATIKVFGAKENLHSGQYGNFSPNPVFGLSRLLAAMKDESGKVAIPGFYEGVNLSESDMQAMAEVPESMEEILDELGIAKADQVGGSYQEAMQFPSLNIRGINAGWVGKEVRTLIPSVAIAEIDIRTVKETPGERQIALLRKFITDQGYHIIAGEEPSLEERKAYSKLASFDFRIGSQPFRTSMDSDFALWLEAGMKHVFGSDYIKTRQTGGSQPMAPFINILNAPAVSVRIPNPDNNIHGPNENIRIGNYLEGIQTCLSILSQPFQ